MCSTSIQETRAFDLASKVLWPQSNCTVMGCYGTGTKRPTPATQDPKDLPTSRCQGPEARPQRSPAHEPCAFINGWQRLPFKVSTCSSGVIKRLPSIGCVPRYYYAQQFIHTLRSMCEWGSISWPRTPQGRTSNYRPSIAPETIAVPTIYAETRELHYCWQI